MTNDDIIRAWKADEDEGKENKDRKNKKSKKALKVAPNPVGEVRELSDADLANVAGGSLIACQSRPMLPNQDA